MVITDLLSPNKKDFEPIGGPGYLKVCVMSMICSVAPFAVTNSEPYVTVSTVACFLEYQSTEVLLAKWQHPVRDLHLTENYAKHTFQAPCSCFKSGLTIDLLLFKTINVSID